MSIRSWIKRSVDKTYGSVKKFASSNTDKFEKWVKTKFRINHDDHYAIKCVKSIPYFMKQFIKKAMYFLVVRSAQRLVMNAHVVFSLFLRSERPVSIVNAIRDLMLRHSPFVLSIVGIIAAVQSGSETIRKISELSKKGRDTSQNDADKKNATETSKPVEVKDPRVDDVSKIQSKPTEMRESRLDSEAFREEGGRSITDEARVEEPKTDEKAGSEEDIDPSKVVEEGGETRVDDVDDSQSEAPKKMVGVAPKVEFNMIGGDVLSAFEVVRLGVAQGWHATVRYGIPSLGRFGRSSAIGIRNECAVALKKLTESAQHVRSIKTSAIQTEDSKVSALEAGIGTSDKTSGVTAVGFFPSLHQYAQRQFYVGAGSAQQPSSGWLDQLSTRKSDLRECMLEEGLLI
ncbi:MAG: hypothetical protein VYC40_03090 [Pseudomonadota bacterium]|nr:hypothetical protein [Pseudomonadota bacterium]